jgi:predicted  nucleic acid-binding Zn-ribbon protein
MSDAELISGVDQLYERDRRRLKQVHLELQKAENEYKDARKEFEQLNDALMKRKEQLKESGSGSRATSVPTELAVLERHWQLAKDLFDLVIQKQKLLQAQMATVEEKIQLEKAALDRLTGEADKKSPAKPSTDVQPAAPTTKPEESVPTGWESFGLPGVKATSAPETQQPPASVLRRPADATDQELPPEVLLQAREDLQEKRVDLKNAKDRVQGIDQALKVFENEVKNEQQLNEIARRQAENAEEMSRALNEAMGAPSGLPGSLADLRGRSQDAEIRLKEARVEVEQRSERTETLQTQLDRVKNARARTEENYQEALTAVDVARQKVEWWKARSRPTESISG